MKQPFKAVCVRAELPASAWCRVFEASLPSADHRVKGRRTGTEPLTRPKGMPLFSFPSISKISSIHVQVLLTSQHWEPKKLEEKGNRSTQNRAARRAAAASPLPAPLDRDLPLSSLKAPSKIGGKKEKPQDWPAAGARCSSSCCQEDDAGFLHHIFVFVILFGPIIYYLLSFGSLVPHNSRTALNLCHAAN